MYHTESASFIQYESRSLGTDIDVLPILATESVLPVSMNNDAWAYLAQPTGTIIVNPLALK